MAGAELAAFGRGFALGGSLIVAIGAQNAYVLRQGLKREFVLLLASQCFLSDALLIALGAAGFGSLVQSEPLLVRAVSWGGAAFLFLYGLRALRAALRPGVLDTAFAAERPTTRRRVLATGLAVSFLNPHVYLDTVVLVGGIAGQYPGLRRLAFALGAAAASFVWFFGLGYGAAWLAPLFRRPGVWRALDLVIAATMWAIAASLLRSALVD